MTAVVLIEGLVIALLATLVVGLLKSHAEILRALHDLGVNLEEGRDHDHTFRLRDRPTGEGRASAAAARDALGLDRARPQ